MSRLKLGEITIEIQRSRRKSLVIEVGPGGKVIVKAPLLYPARDIERFVIQKETWIRRKLSEQKRKQKTLEERNRYLTPFTEDEIRQMQSDARRIIPGRVAYYAPIVGVTYNRIAIRGQKTRWGSCSSKGNLNFNFLLTKVPEDVLDYVVVHELCHRKHMNHSREFWNEVARVVPDYREKKKWLRNYGGILINRLLMAREQ